MNKDNKDLEQVYLNIKGLLEEARKSIITTVNTTLVKTYWEVGRTIVEEEQKGKERARYDTFLLFELSKRLTKEFGSGFDETNLRKIRQFYINFPIRDTLRLELTWSHYRLIMRIDNDQARNFYINESINSKWSTRELERQINSLLFERLSLSKDKKRVLELSKKGQIIKKPEDIIKEPFVLEFLSLKEDNSYHESDFEQKVINKLKSFLLELGKGFSFVARQKRITVGEDNFYIDLVFYNYFLKCFVIIELKKGKLTHKDIGQIDFYVRYFEKEIRSEGDNPTIGIILCSDKNKVKYLR